MNTTKKITKGMAVKVKGSLKHFTGIDGLPDSAGRDIKSHGRVGVVTRKDNGTVYVRLGNAKRSTVFYEGELTIPRS